MLYYIYTTVCVSLQCRDVLLLVWCERDHGCLRLSPRRGYCDRRDPTVCTLALSEMMKKIDGLLEKISHLKSL